MIESTESEGFLMAKIFLSYSVKDGFDLALKIEKGL
jgi:hypothetical protein